MLVTLKGLKIKSSHVEFQYLFTKSFPLRILHLKDYDKFIYLKAP